MAAHQVPLSLRFSRQEHWSGLPFLSPKISIPTLKPSSTQEPTSSSARHTTIILQQNRNTTLNIKSQVTQNHAKPKDTPKLTTGHFIALQREEIQLHSPELRHRLPKLGNLDKPLVQPHPQGAVFTIRRTSIQQKGLPKHSNLNKIQRQRNMHQIKKYDKSPPNQTKEEEIGSLPEK